MVTVLCQVCVVVTALLAGCPARVILEAGGGGGGGGGYPLALAPAVPGPELPRVLLLLPPPPPLAEPSLRPYSGYSGAQRHLQKRNMFGRII